MKTTPDMRSAKPAYPDLLGLLGARLATYPGREFLLAFSGGLDSTVLLHLLGRLRSAYGLRAIHIDHGLQVRSKIWAAHCQEICANWNIPFEAIQVSAHAAPGESPEAAARQARYQALAEHLRTNEILLTAHHQDDQAETFLLRLLRGAGPQGLGAIRPLQKFSCGWLARPLLTVARAQLLAYAQNEKLVWIEDFSNADQRFDRNFLRHEILPRLTARWPGVNKVLARDAALQAEAAELLATLASSDLALAGDTSDRSLNITKLKTWSRARQKNLLHYWLTQNAPALANEIYIEQILEQVIAARVDAMPEVRHDEVAVKRYRQRLYLLSSKSPQIPADRQIWNTVEPFPLPDGSRLTIAQLAAQGIVIPQNGKVEIAFNLTGLKLKMADDKHHKSFKKLCQEKGIPPWQRRLMPVIYIDGRLVAVMGLGVVSIVSDKA